MNQFISAEAVFFYIKINKTGKETLAHRSLRCFKQVLKSKIQGGKNIMLGKIDKQKTSLKQQFSLLSVQISLVILDIKI